MPRHSQEAIDADAGFSLYVELGQLDSRDGTPEARHVQRLRELYEWRCMGDEPIPHLIPDDA